MQVHIYPNYEALSSAAADEIVDMLKTKPDAVLCFAAGETPRGTYSLLPAKAKEKGVDFSRCTFIGLDEWVGISPQNEGSCHFFLQKYLFEPLRISSSQVHLFDGMAENIDQQCQVMDDTISKKGSIDLMLVGVGMNGHIGFNEPGVPFDKYSHVIDLDETTQLVGQKYFAKATRLKQGITLGLKHLMHASKVTLLANGVKKAEVISKAVDGEVDVNLPASIIQLHKNAKVMIDEEAASLCRPRETV